ncbi:ArsR/SmtB family transcription factor [Streptomyces massasporeus]|uniref:ArsR/SmtB family transcription factor n=1 Tax=Streptomyces massasporeus TaxID=67324 RepID=UPI0037032499
MSKQELVVIGQDGESDGCCPGLVTAPLDDVQAAELAKLFKALGDPVRLRLLSMIASRSGGEVCVCDLTPAFDLSQPTISHHLKLLRQAGLIDCERRGTWVYYWVLPGTLDRLSAFLATARTADADTDVAVAVAAAAAAAAEVTAEATA